MSEDSRTVLLVEDNPDDAELTARGLEAREPAVPDRRRTRRPGSARLPIRDQRTTAKTHPGRRSARPQAPADRRSRRPQANPHREAHPAGAGGDPDQLKRRRRPDPRLRPGRQQLRLQTDPVQGLHHRDRTARRLLAHDEPTAPSGGCRPGTGGNFRIQCARGPGQTRAELNTVAKQNPHGQAGTS